MKHMAIRTYCIIGFVGVWKYFLIPILYGLAQYVPSSK